MTTILLQIEDTNYFLQFFGRFHPLIVHLPIGLLLLAAGLEILTRRERYANLRPAVSFTLFWGMLSAAVACVLGYLLSLDGGYDESGLDWHMWMGISVAVVAAVAYFVKRTSENRSEPILLRAQMPLAIGLLVLLTVTGHLGGNLTHGSDYLTQPLVAAITGPPAPKVRKKITNVEQALVYQELVEPLLEDKCWQCHNAGKIKGGLRMDTQALLLKGGEEGPILKPGDALQSEMIKRLLLPEEDEHHMPPKGKTQLSDQEVALLHWWIAQGASFDKKVAQLAKDDKIKPVLATFGSGGVATESEEDKVLKTKVAAASAGNIEKLTKQNVLVMPVANESTLLMVNTVNAPAFNDQAAEGLSGLSEQVVWLKLGNTKISDNALKSVGKLKNLTRLSLDQTAVTDAGLSNLNGLKHLEHLNLYGTKITDAGLKSLAGLKTLKTLYLWQTAVTPAAVAALKKSLPNAQIDTGGYALQKLPTDTLVFKKKEKTT